MNPNKHFLRFCDFDVARLQSIITRGLEHKKAKAATTSLQGMTLAMLFAMPSTRTRVSFEAGISQLGGVAIYIDVSTTQLARNEPVADTARVFSSMCNAVIIRTQHHSFVEKFARHCEVTVINALTDLEHPCQVLADVMTFQELRGPLTAKKIAWIGDNNNVCRSWMQAACLFGFELAVATPPGYDQFTDGYKNLAGVSIGNDKVAAVTGAAAVITDVWASMGDNATERKFAFQNFGVDSELMAQASADAIFMHCLPAHRGEEVTAEVIDGAQSVVWVQSENRLHVQKALLEDLLSGATTS